MGWVSNLVLRTRRRDGVNVVGRVRFMSLVAYSHYYRNRPDGIGEALAIQFEQLRKLKKAAMIVISKRCPNFVKIGVVTV